MNMQMTTNYFCLSYKSSFLCWHFGRLQIVDSQPKTWDLDSLNPTVWKVPASKTLFPFSTLIFLEQSNHKWAATNVVAKPLASDHSSQNQSEFPTQSDKCPGTGSEPNTHYCVMQMRNHVVTINDDYWCSLVGDASGAVLKWVAVASSLLLDENCF